MKTFEELLNEAKTTSTKRSKVLARLIKQTQNEFIPAFCDICHKLDIEKVYFNTQNRVIESQDTPMNCCGDDYESWVLVIDVKLNTIGEAAHNCEYGRYHVPENWPDLISIQDTYFLTKGIIEFVTSLKSRLENYIKKYNELNTKAIKLLSK